MYFDLARGLGTNGNGRLRAAVYLNVTYSDPSSSESHFPYRQLSKQREIKHITLSKHIELSKPTDNQTTWWTKRLIYRGGICGGIGRGNKSSTSTWLHPKVRGCGYCQMQSLSASTPLDSEVPTQWATFGGTHALACYPAHLDKLHVYLSSNLKASFLALCASGCVWWGTRMFQCNLVFHESFEELVILPPSKKPLRSPRFVLFKYREP